MVEAAVRGRRRHGGQADPGGRRSIHDSGRNAAGIRVSADGVGGVPAGDLDVSESACGAGACQGPAFPGRGRAAETRRFDRARTGGDGHHRGAAGEGVSERGRRLGSQGHAAQRCPATEGSAAGPGAGDGGGIAGAADRVRQHREPAGGARRGGPARDGGAAGAGGDVAPPGTPTSHRERDAGGGRRRGGGAVGLWRAAAAEDGAARGYAAGRRDRNKRRRVGIRGGGIAADRGVDRGAPGRAGLVPGGRAVTARNWTARLLVAAEVALALVLLDGAGLLVESFRRASNVDLGFRKEHVLTMRLQLTKRSYADGQRVRAFREELLRRVHVLPGVQFAGTVSSLPMGLIMQGTEFEIEGRPETEGEKPFASYANTSVDYLRAMGIPLTGGRYFETSDGPAAQPVTIVSESLARTDRKSVV